MATEEDGLEIDPINGSWCQGPHDVGRSQSTSILVVASGSDDAHDIEEGVRAPLQQSSTSHPAVSHSRSFMRASRPSVGECLDNLPEEEMADMSLDVYNMFYLSDIGSQGFVYSVAVFIIKFSLYVLLLLDLTYNKQFPSQQTVEATPIVRTTQLFLMPVAIVTQEELITSFFIFSHLKYSPSIRKRHPTAYKWKYIVAAAARFTDGCIFLFINICVMLLQDTDVLGLFLNFAALMFLQTIDNIALQVCLDGYWTQSLRDTAQDVVDMKFAYRHNYVHRCMQTSFVVGVWIALLGFWIAVHYKEN